VAISIAVLPSASAGRDDAQQAWDRWEEQRRYVSTEPSIKTQDGNLVLTSKEKCTMDCKVDFVKGTSMDADVTALQDTQVNLQDKQAELSSLLAQTESDLFFRLRAFDAQTEKDLSAKITSLEGELKTTKDTLSALKTKVFQRCAFNKGNGQYESAPATANTDRECTTIAKCGGETYERVPPTPYSDRVCQSLTKCAPGKTIEAKKPTPTMDRICTTLTLCFLGTSYQVKAPTATTDRVCKAITKCKDGESVVEAATAVADQKCAVLGLTAGAPLKTCADAKKTGDYFVMVDGSKSNVAKTRCWSYSNSHWTLVGRANGSGREFNPKAELWDDDTLLNEKSSSSAKTSMKNAFWTGTKATKMMVCFKSLTDGCQIMPLKDSRRSFVGKTLKTLFSSGKSVQMGISMDKYASNIGWKGEVFQQRVDASQWCGINKGSCCGQCGCSGGGPVRDSYDVSPKKGRGWVVRIGCIGDYSSNHCHLDDSGFGIGVTNCGDGGGCCGTVNSRNMAYRDGGREGTRYYQKYTAGIYIVAE